MSFIRNGAPWSWAVLLGLGTMAFALAIQFSGAVETVAAVEPAAKGIVFMLPFSGGAMALLGAIAWFATREKKDRS